MSSILIGSVLVGAALVVMVILAYWTGFKCGVDHCRKTMEAMHQDHIETLKRVL